MGGLFVTYGAGSMSFKMAAQFCYGRRGDRLVHVTHLDQSVERGLRCKCVCPQCGRPLQAHLDELKGWNFQHHVEAANCQPQPMTLLHAFVRDELAARTQLHVPAKRVQVHVDKLGRRWDGEVELEAADLTIERGETECRVGAVQPDVLLHLEASATFAVEVRYSHAVDDEKTRLLSQAFDRCAEYDVSDLPPSA